MPRRNRHSVIPAKGDRIEVGPRTGVAVRGTVFYADELQILVKWDDGRSRSLRPGVDHFSIVGPADDSATERAL